MQYIRIHATLLSTAQNIIGLLTHANHKAKPIPGQFLANNAVNGFCWGNNMFAGTLEVTPELLYQWLEKY